MARKGVPVTLRRLTAGKPPTFTDVPVSSLFAAFKPGQLTGGIEQGDAKLGLLPVDPAPKRGDSVVIDGATWAVQGVTPCHDGPELAGFDLWIRGGK